LTPNISQIEIDIGQRCGTTDEGVAVDGTVEGSGIITESAIDESRLTGVAYTDSARPLDGHIAGFCEFEDILVPLIPGYR
jgi:hypothetical protein